MNIKILNTVSLNRVLPNVVQLNSTGARKKEKIDYIKFADAEVERICLANFDSNGDGKIQFEEASAVTSFRTAFNGNQVMETFDEGKYFDGIKDLKNAFADCNKLQSIVLAGEITGSAESPFLRCTGLRHIDLSKLNLNRTTSLHGFFFNCKSIQEIILDALSLQRVSMAYMFFGCAELKTIKITNSNLSKVWYMAVTFGACPLLENIILTNTVLPEVNISLDVSPLLSFASVENIINALPYSTTYPTLTLHADAKARYDAVYGEEACEDAVIDKGWILA